MTYKCKTCSDGIRWNRSPLCLKCLRRVGLLLTADGQEASDGDIGRVRLYGGRFRTAAVRCGKADCKVCVGGGRHKFYCYLTWTVEGKPRQRYLGPVAEVQDSYKRPSLRRPMAAWGRAA